MDTNKPKLPNPPSGDQWLKLTIGNFGKWQCWISFLLSLFKFPIAWVQMSIIFLAPPTQFWCSPPLMYRNMSDEDWLRISKPREFSFNQGHLHNGFCEMKSLDDGNETMPCPYGFDYNTTVFKTSIISEWDLICGNERLVDVSQIILMTGILIGNILFGLYADQYGRKIILIICVVIQTIFGFIATWSPYFWGFVAARFLVAVANGGTLVVSFVMCIEIVGGKWRAIVPILVQAPFGIGFSLMALFAYYTRDWRQFHYVISALSALFLWYIWLIPESPRWLFVKGRQEEGRKVLEQAARINGIDSEVFEKKFSKLSNLPTDSKKPSFMDLFKTRTIARRVSWLCIIWFFGGMSFFTITQYVGHVGQNIFFSTAVGGLLCIPGQMICLYMIGRFGRKNTIAFWTSVCAVCFLSIMAFPKGHYPYDWQRMSFAGIGIIGLSVTLCALYLFTGELLPTVVRNTGMGLCSVCSRIGSMAAPIVIALHDTAPFLPLLLLGIFNIVETCLILMLPETEGTVLPELIDDLDRDADGRNTKNNNYIEVPTREDLDVCDVNI
ncbi:organic cation transporter protein-like isoform X4 [Harmonia axyridis]|uniref:organic cation transporter protein-like isoform X4 n=1 Tax=Harmonia axyridis TaxID=115357 RepID=UPI001E276C3A|nr:organic cation transporter protein-like isoform X4 [Harmonia axyridis]XP_045468547.1 organic cation transporter protein-like isoform X4 [Harmonia axyridis]XP_045468548.1 organic cation transporter protein-like isoform X4 [Harmonia axyridis]